MNVRAVILAAGRSERMGRQKLLMPFRGKPMIQHAIAACRDWDPLIVASPDLATFLQTAPGLTVVLNEHPELGMSHSLELAHEALPPEQPIIVLLGDKPLVTRSLIASICDSAAGADLVYPRRGAQPGHPVFFSAAARSRIPALPPGDSLRELRTDPALICIARETQDEGAYFDVDRYPLDS